MKEGFEHIFWLFAKLLVGAEELQKHLAFSKIKEQFIIIGNCLLILQIFITYELLVNASQLLQTGSTHSLMKRARHCSPTAPFLCLIASQAAGHVVAFMGGRRSYLPGSVKAVTELQLPQLVAPLADGTVSGANRKQSARKHEDPLLNGLWCIWRLRESFAAQRRNV